MLFRSERFISLFGTSAPLKGTPGSNNVNGFGVSVDDKADYHGSWKNLFLMGLSGDDVIRTGHGADFLAGGSDDDRLLAGAGNDILFGGSGNDWLRGGAGSDTFVFSGKNGDDRVVDFEATGKAHDVIDLTGLRGIGDWHDLKHNHLEVAGHSVVIEDSHGDTIVLKDVALTDLTKADFLL